MREGTEVEQSQVGSPASGPDAGRRRVAGQLGVVAYILSIGAALATSRIAGFPWEVFLLVLIGACAGIWFGVARGSLSGLGFGRRGWLAQAALGFGVAAGITVLALLALMAAGLATISVGRSVPLAVAGALLLSPLIALGTTALPEEVLFRGFFQRTLTPWLGPGAASALSALLFALAHLPQRTSGNTGVTTLGFLALQLLLLVAFGLLMSWTVIRTGTLWLAIGWHFGGNYVGLVVDQLVFTSRYQGPAWLLGLPPNLGGDGAFGVLLIAVQAAVLAVLLRARAGFILRS
jgi:membrane protease YdiL (CAAX protease family)